jgi:eukaryotic-like serine/threonine-protein kinase
VFLGEPFSSAATTTGSAVIWSTGTGRGTATDPAPAGTIVYVGGNDNLLYALRASDGSTVWIFHSGGRVTDPVVTGVVYLSSFNDRLYALQA